MKKKISLAIASLCLVLAVVFTSAACRNTKDTVDNAVRAVETAENFLTASIDVVEEDTEDNLHEDPEYPEVAVNGSRKVKPGQKVEYRVVLDGITQPNNAAFLWTVSRNTSEKTSIKDGVLMIGDDEQSEYLILNVQGTLFGIGIKLNVDIPTETLNEQKPVDIQIASEENSEISEPIEEVNDVEKSAETVEVEEGNSSLEESESYDETEDEDYSEPSVPTETATTSSSQKENTESGSYSGSYSLETLLSNKRAAAGSENAGWYDIIEEVLLSGSYTMDLSGYNDAYGPVERAITSSLENYYYNNFGYKENLEEWPFDITFTDSQCIIRLNEVGQRLSSIPDRIVSMFGAYRSGSDWSTVYDTMDRVMSGMTYDYAYQECTMTEVLNARRGVCWAYAEIGCTLLNAEGIPARVVTGDVDFSDEGHAWVEALIDGSWHYVDFTWGQVDSASYTNVDEEATISYDDAKNRTDEAAAEEAAKEAERRAKAEAEEAAKQAELDAMAEEDRAAYEAQQAEMARVEAERQTEIDRRNALSEEEKAAEDAAAEAAQQAVQDKIDEVKEMSAEERQAMKDNAWAELESVLTAEQIAGGSWSWNSMLECWVKTTMDEAGNVVQLRWDFGSCCFVNV